MNGITVIHDSSKSAWVCHISRLSKDLKSLIRERLSSICHGGGKYESNKNLYSYKNTLSKFLTTYNTKPPNTKKGLIGELLAHILILEYNKKLSVASPFFNMEERSNKKGFDLVLYSKADNDIWFTEVKSGNGGQKGADSKNRSLLGIAKRDLKKRLNENNSMIWDNAINGALITLKEGNTKKRVKKILEQGLSDTHSSTSNSTTKKVILVAVTYNPLNEKISHKSTEQFRKNLSKQNTFDDIIIFSIQKKTYQRIATFLTHEASK